MSILGVESAVFAVDDLETCARFRTDFGMRPVAADDEASFEPYRKGNVAAERASVPKVTEEEEHAI